MDPGALVRRCRLTAGITQQRLAVRAGTTKTAISRLEGGHVSPTVETLERLLLCMGYQYVPAAIPLATRADPSQLAAVAELTPTQRVDHALASQASLARLVGAVRDR